MKQSFVKSSDWLPDRGSSPRATLRLLCFPYAGGSESIFRNWQDEVPDTIEVSPVQLPGRGARVKEPPYNDLRVLVEAAAHGLISRMDKPFAIFGHSMGGIIGFELARQFRREYGIEPVHLFISARCSPQSLAGQKMPRLSDQDLRAALEKGDGTPKEVLEDPELMNLLLPLLRADFAIGKPDVFKRERPLDCPITVFGGLSDPSVGRACLEGWREHTSKAFLIRMVQGGHFFLDDARSLILSAITTELHRR